MVSTSREKDLQPRLDIQHLDKSKGGIKRTGDSKSHPGGEIQGSGPKESFSTEERVQMLLRTQKRTAVSMGLGNTEATSDLRKQVSGVVGTGARLK